MEYRWVMASISAVDQVGEGAVKQLDVAEIFGPANWTFLNQAVSKPRADHARARKSRGR